MSRSFILCLTWNTVEITFFFFLFLVSHKFCGHFDDINFFLIVGGELPPTKKEFTKLDLTKWPTIKEKDR